MSASPTAGAAAPSQKRPLEEPSSPPGPGEQPDAKRPALDKTLEEAGAIEPDTLQPAEVKPDDDKIKAEPVASSDINDAQDGQGDTVVPDAPTLPTSQAMSDAQPIMSTASNGRTGSQSGHQDETNWLHLRAIISSAEAATVIGKGGENVTMIRRNSGAKCTVSDYSRGAVERILTVSGAVDAVAKVCSFCLKA